MDPAGMGTYGSLKVLKKKTDEFVACFPIDDEELTFGRNPECGVRLYYPTVSMFHCKIIFKEGQAFLVVMGANGVHVDDMKVFPSMMDSPAVVTLDDGSIIEIQKKRFEYNYPPKNYRAQAIIDSPLTARRRSLRMSMIEAAQVFTPNPPRVKTPSRAALRNAAQPVTESDGSDLIVRMLEGDVENSVVIESEKDVIVLEHIQDENQRLEQISPPPVICKSPSTPARLSTPMFVAVGQSPAKSGRIISTPRRRSEPSLHKAVLLRSAQRALQERRREQEEQEEEQEVELSVSPVHFSEDDEDGAANEADGEIGEIPDDIDDEEMPPTPSKPVKGALRKSLDAVCGMLPFKWSSSPPESRPTCSEKEDERVDHNDYYANAHVEDNDDDEEEEEEIAEVQVIEGLLPPKPRILGPFMTPQRVRPNHTPMALAPGAATVRVGARRVPILDLEKIAADSTAFKRGPQRIPIRTPSIDSKEGRAPQAPVPEPHDPAVSEEQKRQIREKRRSINPDTFPQLPSLANWNSKPIQKGLQFRQESSSAVNEDVNLMLSRLQEQTAEMRRKSLARQSLPRHSISPVKADYAFASAPLLPPKFFNEAKDELKETPPLSTSSAAVATTTPIILNQPPSPTKSVQRKLPELPALPVLDLNSIPGLSKATSHGRPQVPQTPAIKSVRNLFKSTGSRPQLDSPNVEAAAMFMHRLEVITDAVEKSEIEEILDDTQAREQEIKSEEESVEEALDDSEEQKKHRISALPVRPSQESLHREKHGKAVKNQVQAASDNDKGISIPPKPPMTRTLRHTTRAAGSEAVVKARPQNQTGTARRPPSRISMSEDSDTPVKEVIIDTQVPITKAKKASAKTRGKAKAKTKTETTEEDEVDELDCLSPVKEIRTLRSRTDHNQVQPTRKTKAVKSETEAPEKSEESKTKATKKSASIGRAGGKKTRSKMAEVDSEDHTDKENAPIPAARASRVPARRVRKEVKEEPVVETPPVRMTRTRARKLQ